MPSVIPDISKASLPITVVAAMLMAGLSYWVNAQERELEDLSTDIEKVDARVDELDDELTERKLDVEGKLGDIRTQQALDAQLLRQIARKLEVQDDDG